MAIKLRTSDVKKIFLGTSSVKLAYLGTSLVFARPQTLTVSVGTGVQSITYTATTHDGKKTTDIIGSTTTLTFGYDTTVAFNPYAKAGYKMDSYTSSTTMTSDKTLSFTATAQSYTTKIQFVYNSTAYQVLGSVQYSFDKSTWYTITSTTSLTTNYGALIYLRSPTTKAGFAYNNMTYNGSTVSASGGIYTVTVGAGSYNINVNYISSTSTSSITWSYAEVTTTNTLSRTAFTVTCNVNIKIKSASAGTVLGTIPADYRPYTNKTMTTDWYHLNGNKQNTATITFATNGNVTSSAASNGTGTQAAGGKWGSTVIPYYTLISGTATWTVI